MMLAMDSLYVCDIDESATAIIVELMGTRMAPNKSETISAHSFLSSLGSSFCFAKELTGSNSFDEYSCTMLQHFFLGRSNYSVA